MKHFTKLGIVSALTVSLVLASFLSGCGGRSNEYSPSAAPSSSSMAAASARYGKGSDMAANRPSMNQTAADSEQSPETGGGEFAEAAPSDGFSSNALSAAAPPAAEQTRKLIKDSDLQLETKEFDTALQSLLALVQQSGGYVDNQWVDGQSLRNPGDYYERRAIITVRVPTEKLDGVTEQLGTLCNIVAHSETVRDITDSYYDAASRLEMLQVKETRLLDLLSKAEKLEDIIKLEDALTTCQYEIESLSGQLRRMDNRVTYSTLNINLSEVVEYKVPSTAPATFGEKLIKAMESSVRRLSRSTQNFILGLIEVGPVTVLFLAIWGAIIYLVYRLFFKKRLQKKHLQQVASTKAAEPAPDTDSTPEA